MIGLLIYAQVLSTTGQEMVSTRYKVSEFADIVQPVVECEYSYKKQQREISERWLEAMKVEAAKISMGTSDGIETASESDAILVESRNLKKFIEKSCDREVAEKLIHKKLIALNPNLSEIDAYSATQRIFGSLKSLNNFFYRYQSGNIPRPAAPPPPPPPPPSAKEK